MRSRVSARTLGLVMWSAVILVAVWSAFSHLAVRNPRRLWDVSPPLPAHEYWTFTQSLFEDRDVLLVGLQIASGHGRSLDSAAMELQGWIRERPEVARVFGVQELMMLVRRVGPLGGRLLSAVRGAVINREAGVALTYVVLVEPHEGGGLAEKQSFLAALQSSGMRVVPPGSSIILAGQPAVDVALDRLLRHEFETTVPMALVVVVVSTLFAIGWVGIPAVVTVAVALMVLIGGMAVARVPVSSATAVALPLTVVVGVSYGAHVSMAVAAGGLAALRRIRAPLAWSYLTTLIALGSFGVSPIRGLRLFAASASAGLTVAFLAGLSLTPLLRPGRETRWARRARRALTRVGVGVFQRAAIRPRRALTVWIVLGGVVAVGVLRVRIEPNSYTGLFPGDHPIVDAHRALDAAFGGSMPMQVLARADSGVAYRQERVRVRLNEYMTRVREEVGTSSALTPPPGRFIRRDDELHGVVAHWFAGRDSVYARGMFALPVMSTADARLAIDKLEAVAADLSDDAVLLTVTGLLPASLPMQDLLVGLMAKSLLVLSLFVAVALVLVARSISGGLILMIPNLMAVVAVLGLMGFLAIPIDFTTVSVASLVLGVAVDDTLQLTWAGRRDEGHHRFSPGRAVRRTATPVLLGSFAMIAGALTLAFSPFPPTQRLGGLLGVGLAVALAADLTLTPLLLAARKTRRSVGQGV